MFGLVVMGWRVDRVSPCLEVLVGESRVLGLSPSRIVIPFLCAGCVRARVVWLVMRMRGGAE